MNGKKPMTKKPTKKRATKKAKAVKKPYEPTEKEEAVLGSQRGRRKTSRSIPIMKLTGENQLTPDHPDLGMGTALVLEAFGTSSLEFMDGIVGELMNASTRGREPEVGKLNYMLSIVSGIEPRDQIETMLAAQMAAVHMQMMTFTRRLNHVDNIPQQDSAERAFNKLARTFTTQMEALNKYRGKGQQKMTVEHVHVHEGGQAIVGNVQGGGGQRKNKDSTP